MYYFSKKGKEEKRKEFEKDAGFTLIELLIVIAIIAVLMTIAFVALDPLRRFQDSRDTKRWADAQAISNAIKLSQADNGGLYFSAINNAATGTNYMISSGTTTSGCNTACDVTIPTTWSCINLDGLVTGGYLGALPISPNGTGSWSSSYTGYYFNKSTSSQGAITIGACESENVSSISIIK